jgi:hypothetical protein
MNSSAVSVCGAPGLGSNSVICGTLRPWLAGGTAGGSSVPGGSSPSGPSVGGSSSLGSSVGGFGSQPSSGRPGTSLGMATGVLVGPAVFTMPGDGVMCMAKSAASEPLSWYTGTAAPKPRCRLCPACRPVVLKVMNTVRPSKDGTAGEPALGALHSSWSTTVCVGTHAPPCSCCVVYSNRIWPPANAIPALNHARATAGRYCTCWPPDVNWLASTYDSPGASTPFSTIFRDGVPQSVAVLPAICSRHSYADRSIGSAVVLYSSINSSEALPTPPACSSVISNGGRPGGSSASAAPAISGVAMYTAKAASVVRSSMRVDRFTPQIVPNVTCHCKPFFNKCVHLFDKQSALY